MVLIRHYTENDAEALWHIFFNTIRIINSRDYSQSQVEAWAPESFDFSVWKTKMRTINPFVAEINGVIVGYTDLQSSGLIDHFFCHHEFQGKGVGRALMDHVMSQGKALNITRFYSEVSITAKPFYKHFGFTVVNEQTIEVRGEKLVNYVMEKFS
ncbi:GNAT family N-acetyltransferase [Enterovibrio norvegicus]|uniref:GNAT family N-acetyltransferase n=1 Tax=Enterovibrio norvegicus TaxID=188144 RepID=UPI0003796407|nr:GNAT family N-acetyltransferase [Enterovibrio norvegicus]MCC4801134.1 GNAT family N-acetyltransferase [Enterovibrio norvegicus]OEE69038.1 GNAT family N-acetyltransferase [Enterovibrio norvegicus]PMI41057.1 GNAT family N-acetyltransferase [Enterovibrio norvegicus]PMN43571.1 GNAT family N-acetyltransferase [Enterovibrio norvegicus]TKF25272.1 GNAT family N-acetyltransferase [Enterovibrio norvegicus]